LKSRKEKDRKIEACVQQGELRFLQLAAAILGLELRFDRIGVRHFASALELLRQL
jgi:hypothetical protein